jgi:hypothetical protein
MLAPDAWHVTLFTRVCTKAMHASQVEVQPRHRVGATMDLNSSTTNAVDVQLENTKQPAELAHVLQSLHLSYAIKESQLGTAFTKLSLRQMPPTSIKRHRRGQWM